MRIIIHSDGIQVEVWELDKSYRPKYVTGDIDNYAKAISDGLNKFAYLDDKQVHHLEVFFTKEDLETDNDEEAGSQVRTDDPGGAPGTVPAGS